MKLLKIIAGYSVAFIILCLSIYALVLADDYSNRAVLLGFYLASFAGIILAIAFACVDFGKDFTR